MSKTFTDKPIIKIDYLVHQKVMHWVLNTDKEISGLGKIIREGEMFRIIDAILLPQRNTQSTTDIEPEDVGKAMFELRETPGELRWWWHSHVNMGTFWSGTDDDTMEKLSTPGWFIHSVFNKQWNVRTAFQMGKPFGYRIDEIPLNVNHPNISAEIKAQWDEEVKKNVTNVTTFRHGRGSGQTPTKGTVRVWDVSLGKFVEREYSSKRERKALKRLARGVGGPTSGEVRLLEGGKHIPDPCIFCNFTFACKCDEREKETAEQLDGMSRCYVCALVFEHCECTDADLQEFLWGVIPEPPESLPPHEPVLPRNRRRAAPKGAPAGAPEGQSVGVG
jgi:hypothetical protein